MTQTPKASRIEDGVEICNTCVRPASYPFRYRTAAGDVRGCVSECHDRFVRRNTLPTWMDKTHYVLPKWITDCRKAIRARAA